MNDIKMRVKRITRPWKEAVQMERRAKALARQAIRDSRTPLQQLQMLDSILGIGIGAVKDRKRLQSLLEAVN